MIDKFLKKLDSIILDLFTADNIKGYLDTNAKFYHMPYYNLALIYNQNPNAKYLAGEMIWKDVLQNEIKEGAKPILCLYPKKNEDNLEFEIGTLFDITDTKNPDIDYEPNIDINDTLRTTLGFIIYESNDFQSIENFMVDANEKVIYIDKSLEGTKYNETLIKAYIDYKIKTSKGAISSIKEKKQLVNYVVLNSFGIQIPYAKFKFIDRLKESFSYDEICDFLDDVQLMALEVIQDFMGNFISFEEAQFMNHLPIEEKESFLETNISTKEGFYNKLLQGRTLDIKLLISDLKEEDYQKIVKDKGLYKLTSFPYYYI